MAENNVGDLASTTMAMAEVFKMMEYLVEHRTVIQGLSNDHTVLETIHKETKRLEKLDAIWNALLDKAYSMMLDSVEAPSEGGAE